MNIRIRQRWPIILFLFLIGCGSSNIFAPINNQNNFYENEYFSVNYPQGWTVEKISCPADQVAFLGKFHDATPSNLNYDFKSPFHKKYTFNISLKLGTGFSTGQERDDLWLIASEEAPQAIRFFKDNGYTVISNKITPTQINGMSGYRSEVETDRMRSVKIFIGSTNGVFLIQYWLWNDFTEWEKNRIEECAFSLHSNI